MATLTQAKRMEIEGVFKQLERPIAAELQCSTETRPKPLALPDDETYNIGMRYWPDST